MQNPTPMEGLMYHAFRTYDELPDRRYARMIGNYTDSADTGFDFLALYVSMHTMTATMLPMFYTPSDQWNIRNQRKPIWLSAIRQTCFVESNNGGRSYARNVERITREHGNRITQFNNSRNRRTNRL